MMRKYNRISEQMSKRNFYIPTIDLRVFSAYNDARFLITSSDTVNPQSFNDTSNANDGVINVQKIKKN